MFGMNIGTKNGDTRSGPFWMKSRQLSSKVCIPPMPLPMTTPTRLRFTSAVSRPDCVTAWCDAAMAYWAKRPHRFDSLRSMYSSGSKPFTSHAKRTCWLLASNLVIGAAPDLPASRFAQLSSVVSPTGDTRPSPVTTTRRFTSLAQLLVQVLERIADGTELLSLLVGDVDVELLLECHHQLDGIERVGAEVFHEGRLVGQLLALDAEFLDDDVLDLLVHVAHLVPRVPGVRNGLLLSFTSADHPAVHDQDLPGYVGREVGDKIEHCSRNVRRRAEPGQRYRLQ